MCRNAEARIESTDCGFAPRSGRYRRSRIKIPCDSAYKCANSTRLARGNQGTWKSNRIWETRSGTGPRSVRIVLLHSTRRTRRTREHHGEAFPARHTAANATSIIHYDCIPCRSTRLRAARLRGTPWFSVLNAAERSVRPCRYRRAHSSSLPPNCNCPAIPGLAHSLRRARRSPPPGQVYWKRDLGSTRRLFSILTKLCIGKSMG
jgi:hypothetical protein